MVLTTRAVLVDNAKSTSRKRASFVVEPPGGGEEVEPHKARVVGATTNRGDPFKGDRRPSLHVLINLLSTITLVLRLCSFV